jgi:predicted alpha/beta-hydrolase family hydrolase
VRTRETTRWEVAVGAARTRAVLEPASEPFGDTLCVLAHGAGAHMDHRATTALADELRARGLHTVRFDFLYRAAGRGRPDPMPQLAACYRAVVASVREAAAPARLLIGGRSLGGRTASMLAAEGLACDGLILCAYPLHAPGRTDAPRDEHLARIEAPVLCLNGTRDALCDKDLMQAVVARLPATWTMRWLEHADHGFHVLKSSGRSDAEVLAEAGAATRAWLERTFGPA